MLVKLGSKRVPNHIVIAAASVAFKECGYQKDLLGRAAIEWETMAGDDLDSETTYQAFKDHWNENLKLIHLHSDTFRPGQTRQRKCLLLLTRLWPVL